MGSPYIDFVASKTVGAFTFATGQQQFIAIHAGIIKMFWTFNVLLSHPMVLRRVGNPHLEVAHQPVDLLIRNIENNPHSTVRKPIDPIRAEFANQLSMICFHFLVAHEVGHLLHGHLEFLEANRTADNLTRHALV